MREIKFRCYNKYLSKRLAGQDIYDELADQVFYNPEKGDDVVLMQYTGLKDKNGKEIYEGDIVEINGGGNFEIVYYPGYFGPVYADGSGDKLEDNDWTRNKIEVIGNIYENSELTN